VCADAVNLPFKNDSFDLIVCHHSLEHLSNLTLAIQEIRRLLTTRARLYVSVPDGRSFTDRLYRLLFCGGGHFQHFAFDQLVRLVQLETGLHLTRWKLLYSSFIYLNRNNFLNTPDNPMQGPLPRRMRWIACLPGWLFQIAKFLLNLGSRLLDRYLGSGLSIYGWAFAFERVVTSAIQEPPFANVCMRCGFAAGDAELFRIALCLYRCKQCGGLNPLFRSPAQ
jgi:hypothetical protein